MPSSSLVFSLPNGATFHRLADAVATGHWDLRARALASRALAISPVCAGDTPYVGITCALRSAGDAASAEPVGAHLSATDGAQMLRAALARAVEKTIGTSRRVAVMAGGGLDSGGLLALTLEWARRTGGTAFAVAADFESEGDDRPHLAALERHLGCEVLRITPEDAAQGTTLTAPVDAAPLCWPTAPLEIAMMRRAREHGADCVLMGVGGDELFDGEPRSLSRLLARGRVLRAVRSARALRGFDRPRFPLASWLVRPLVGRALHWRIRAALAADAQEFVPSWAGRAMRAAVRRRREVAREEIRSAIRRNDDRFLAPTTDRYHAWVASLRHQEEVASGIERRDPYLDAELVAFVRSLPAEWIIAGDERRGLFREAMRGLLPETLRRREDKAFFEPSFVRMLRAWGGPDQLRSLSRGTLLADLGMVEPAGFAEAFEAFAADPTDGAAWTTVIPTLSVEAFLRARERRGAA